MNIITHIPYGRENAISRSELAFKVNMPDRTVREIVREHRSSWTAIEPFICSDSKECGYWLSHDMNEVRAVRNFLASYSKSSGKLLENVDRQLAKLDGTGLVYVRAHYRRVGGGL